MFPAAFMAPSIIKDHTVSDLLPKGKIVYYLGSADVGFHVSPQSIAAQGITSAGVDFVDNSISLRDNIPTLDSARMHNDLIAHPLT
mmetsp:Transcript_20866/g.29447  ORF Transcript_20866/g.29447 Transcript_20866/m.29447 type:complete len:86 (-) Transcript_20866:117-374(-)